MNKPGEILVGIAGGFLGILAFWLLCLLLGGIVAISEGSTSFAVAALLVSAILATILAMVNGVMAALFVAKDGQPYTPSDTYHTEEPPIGDGNDDVHPFADIPPTRDFEDPPTQPPEDD